MDSKDRDILRKELGRRGEDLACAELSGRGMEIFDRNYRSSHNEIDIICRDGSDLRFVEVKARREPVEGEPWEAVDAAKQRRIVSAAKSYISGNGLRRHRFFPEEYHFDVITVVWDLSGERYSLDYIRDAFIPIYA